MKTYIFSFLTIGLFCCNSQQNNKLSENKNNVDNLPSLKRDSKIIFDAFRGKSKNYQIIKYAKYSDKYVKLKNIDDFPEDSDIVLSFLKDKKNAIIYIQEQSETEDGNLTVGYYFNDKGFLFFNTIEGFHFENPCKDNKIRDLTYIKNTYFQEDKIINNEEYLRTDKNIKIPFSDCTFNGDISYKIFKSVNDFLKQNPQLQQAKLN